MAFKLNYYPEFPLAVFLYFGSGNIVVRCEGSSYHFLQLSLTTPKPLH
jgi:hypothetical protein